MKVAEAACVEGETIHNMIPDVSAKELYNAMITCDVLGREAKEAK